MPRSVTGDVAAAYDTLPKSVRVGSFDFVVEVPEAGDSMGEFGHMNIHSQRIRIAPGQTAQNLANTFLHECIHAIHWVYGLWRNDPDEEHYTNQTANGLCQFFQDNPEATAWLIKTNAMGAPK